MRSSWSDEDAARCVDNYAKQGVNEDLALRTYSARLLGSDRRLVMHGGGNTSVKTTLKNLFGHDVGVLCVKGSGRDLAVIEPEGHPAVRLGPLLELRKLSRLSDEDLVNVLRQNLLDSTAPNPSIETLLHAYIPHRFVDHTHAVVSTAIGGLHDSEEICHRLYGDRVAFVPYVMPGFELAKGAERIFLANPRSQGLLLAKHGVFSYAATARESYELMIEFVTLAEEMIMRRGKRPASFHPATLLPESAPAAQMLPVIRGALARAANGSAPPKWILTPRTSEQIRTFVDGRGIADYSIRGVATPEQVIRIKRMPAILSPATSSDLGAWNATIDATVAKYIGDYRAYFERNNARGGGMKRQLDPLPRVMLVPGFGLVGAGKSATDADISCDIAEAWIDAVLDAESIGTFESITEAQHFDVEYWSLEQAKLCKSVDKPLARHIVAVTGAASGIGDATIRAFAHEGAEVVLLDRDSDRVELVAKSIGRKALALTCDVTCRQSVDACFDRVAETFGGVDIVVSNAGAAWTGMMAEMPEETLRESFEINFFAHQNVARAAVRIMRAQGMGGCLLFNVSKQAINPGPDFGAYGTSKSALMALMRQYALEHGMDGIRVNAVNADRIRTRLLSDEMIRQRAKARGVSTLEYMSGNLLRREVLAEDVAGAFVALSRAAATTGSVFTVDGGNVAAMLR